jgi:hypothetical protein
MKSLFHYEKMKTKLWGFLLLCGATLAHAQSIQVLYPNGGETLFTRSTIRIQWTPVNPEMRIVILLFREGAQAAIIADDIPGSGSFAWKIPDQIQPGNRYRIRIRALSNLSVNDFSDRDFSIQKREN